MGASGAVLDGVVANLMHLPFFSRRRAKMGGREEFGREFVQEFMKYCGRANKHNVVATATALTVRSIADALRRFVITRHSSFSEFIVSGGGTNNPTLLAMPANELRPLGLEIRSSDEFGVPSEAEGA